MRSGTLQSISLAGVTDDRRSKNVSNREDNRPDRIAKVVGYDVAGYDAFRDRARDQSLTFNEKAGFPEELRRGQSERILQDIATKLPALNREGSRILDIGAGCSDLTRHVINVCANTNASLTLIDSQDMLALLPDRPGVTKIAGRFPECLSQLSPPIGPFDAILVYSVIQYVFAEGNLFGFIDAAMQLLDREGRLLIGDVPNASMRKRFLASSSGKMYHKMHYPGRPEPVIQFNSLDAGQIDDGVVLGVLARARAAGMHGFAVPQALGLPMANRREDIVIWRP